MPVHPFANNISEARKEVIQRLYQELVDPEQEDFELAENLLSGIALGAYEVGVDVSEYAVAWANHQVILRDNELRAHFGDEYSGHEDIEFTN